MKIGDLSRVGRYEVLAKVGEGANGVVFRAQDPTIRRIVALKVIPAEDEEYEEDEGGTSVLRTTGGTSLFAREAQAAGALHHPNIVTLYDAGRDGSWHYLAMEFVEGETFASELSRGTTTEVRALEVGSVVARALDFAHQEGVVHRDIKPANLMILPDRTVKVADFGIARLTSASATVTKDSLVGTPNYMSPEQVRGSKVDGRSDLYSLGVVLYEALTGAKPFKAQNMAALLNQILNTEPPPLRDLNPEIQPKVAEIISRAMARDADGRFASGAEMAEALESLLPAGHSAASNRTITLRPPAEKRFGTVPAVVLGVALLALAGAGVYVVGTGSRSSGTSGRETAPEAVELGYVIMRSTPPGAEVVVDGTFVGRTPYTAELPAGSHDVEYRLDGHHSVPFGLIVEANSRQKVNMELTAK